MDKRSARFKASELASSMTDAPMLNVFRNGHEQIPKVVAARSIKIEYCSTDPRH
jgi:hypothetical protein